MELSQVSKARGRRKGKQAAYQSKVNANPGATAEQLATEMHPPPRPPSRGLSTRGKIGLGAGVLAAGGTGAYLYQRHRVEKSLSSMQRDWPYMMMRTT